MSIRRALISVYHKDGTVQFAQRLRARFPEVEIVSTGGTATALRAAGFTVIDVSEVTGFPEMLDGRVKTLHPFIHGGILPDRSNPEHMRVIKEHGITPIDLVYCDFYPLAAEIARPGSTLASVIEKTDIGGPAMVRSAAKAGIVVICDPADRERVMAELESMGEISDETRAYLRAKVFAVTTAYDLAAARFHSQGDFDGVLTQKVLDLAYGENRDQSPARLRRTVGNDDPFGWAEFQLVSGLPGFINMADGDRTLGLMCLIAEAFRLNFGGKVPHIVIACKHGNPCGLAVDWDEPHMALEGALLGDSLAVMGAEIMTNFPITGALATALYEVVPSLRKRVGRPYWGPDVVFAPSFDEAAIALLGKRESRRLLANPALSCPTMSPDEWVLRPVRGGFLEQKAPRFVFDLNAAESWTGGLVQGPELASLILAWAAAWRATSNTVALAKDMMLIGLGAGQQDRVACCRLAIERARWAGHDTEGSLFASDGFFPYARRKSVTKPFEGPELLARAGCLGGVVPADGKNLPEVKAFFADHDVWVTFLQKEHRGFSGH